MATGEPQGLQPKEERELRLSEVRSQKYSAWAQLLIGIAAVLAAVVAVIAASVAKTAVQATEVGIQRQTDESRLATAVTAIGGTTPAERVAGVELLRRLVEERLAAAAATPANSWDRWDAHGLYMTSTVILANYLRSVSADPRCLSPMPLDDQYAADELESLLYMKADVLALKVGSIPAIDLSHDELCQQYWPGIRFDWLATAYLKDIDLRGSDLYGSLWGSADLVGAQLQCTNLNGADLSDANLTAADLRGADLLGARLPKGLAPAQLMGSVRVPASKWNPAPCLENKAYWGPLP